MADSEEEPHLSIDAYNNLYILHATKNEESVYYCKVDGVKIQKFDIRIVAKSKVLNQGSIDPIIINLLTNHCHKEWD